MNIYHLLPELNNENHNITSDPTEEYNCVAWGLGEGEMGGDNTTWWEPTPGYYWPEKALPKNPNLTYEVECLIEAAKLKGYLETNDHSFEKGIDKIAIYSKNKEYSHIARQLKNGQWTSKVGDLEDISHKTLEILEGQLYGKLEVVMKRKTPKN